MNKRLSFLFALIFSMSMFTSCEPDEASGLNEKEIAGVYKGELSITVNGDSLSSGIPQKVYITKSNGLLKVELKSFKFQTIDLGSIVVDSCVVSLNNEIHTFSGSKTLPLVGIGSCPVKINGTIDNKNNLSIIIEVRVESFKLDVIASFDGNKLSGNEVSEAKITSFIISSSAIIDQPVIDEANGTISFSVNKDATNDTLMSLTPTISISEKAIITPASGVTQDFSNGKIITYTVIAEDGTIKEYKASIASKLNILKYSFEEWEAYSEVAELPLPRTELASSSEGAALLAGLEQGIPMYKSDDKVAGAYAARLVTVDLSTNASSLIPAITAGSIYTGKFDLMSVFTDRLKCTQFGIPYNTKPLRFKGWYKYTPGKKYIDGEDFTNIIEIPSKIDQCAISAVLFKVNNADEYLDGHNINNSPERVATAILSDGSAKAQYTSFDIPFTFLDGKSYEANASYKLAIVCSSSKEGDTFKGAGGSTLMIDELEVIGE